MRRALALTCVLASCTPAASTDPGETFRPRSTPVEYVGMTLERPFGSEAELLAILDPIFGDAAHAGSGHHDYMLQAGVFMTVTPDGRTPEQAVVTMEMEPSRDPDAGRRIVLQVPVSYAYGGVYIAAVRAALARSMEIISGGEAMQPWHLEYHVVSPNGAVSKRAAMPTAASRRCHSSLRRRERWSGGAAMRSSSAPPSGWRRQPALSARA